MQTRSLFLSIFSIFGFACTASVIELPDQDGGLVGPPTVMPPNPHQGCVDPIDPPSSQCTAFCEPERLDLLIRGQDGAPGLSCTDDYGTAACRGNADYQAFSFANEQIDLYISFDASIVGHYTPEAFAAAFKYLWMNVYFPDPDHLGYKFQTDAIRRGDPRLLELRYEAGRLLGRVSIDAITYVDRRVESREPTCKSDDIAGYCYCTYTISPTPVTVDFNLPVEGA